MGISSERHSEPGPKIVEQVRVESLQAIRTKLKTSGCFMACKQCIFVHGVCVILQKCGY